MLAELDALDELDELDWMHWIRTGFAPARAELDELELRSSSWMDGLDLSPVSWICAR